MFIVRILIVIVFFTIFAGLEDPVSLLRDAVLCTTAIVTVIIAAKGLHTWRLQLTGTSKYKLAREILREVYRTRDKLKFLRSEFVPILTPALPKVWITTTGSYVQGDDLSGDPKSDNTERLKNFQNHNNKLWEEYSEIYQRLEDKMIDGQIVWGKEKKDLLFPLEQLASELREQTSKSLFFDSSHQDISKTFEFDGTYTGSTYNGGAYTNLSVMAIPSNNEPFDKRVDVAIKKFEDWLLPEINNKHKS